MSKLAKKPIKKQSSVNVTVDGQHITVKGPKGELNMDIPSDKITVSVEDQDIWVNRQTNDRQARAQHGLCWALLRNMIHGVVEGYEQRLDMVGVGYRVQKSGQGLSISVGYSHPVEVPAVEGISFETERDNKIIVKGISKQLVGQVAANIRKIRGPEPYKGKGIKYENEHIKRKAGKAGK